jgi:hypothetical protein
MANCDMQNGLKISAKFKWKDIRNAKHRWSLPEPNDINLFGYKQVIRNAVSENLERIEKWRIKNKKL